MKWKSIFIKLTVCGILFLHFDALAEFQLPEEPVKNIQTFKILMYFCSNWTYNKNPDKNLLFRYYSINLNLNIFNKDNTNNIYIC